MLNTIPSQSTPPFPLASLHAVDGARLRATPLARRRAVEAGVPMEEIDGTGPRGRILRDDVEAFIARNGKISGQSLPETGSWGVAAPQAGTQRIPLDGMRATIARRLSAAKRDVPHFYLSTDCCVDRLFRVREELNAAQSVGLSVNDFLIKAWALALQSVPDANASWDDDAIIRHHDVDMAIAVSVPGGILTPVVRQANTKGLTQIAIEARELVGRAREKTLAPREYTGGSTAISNLGMYGVSSFSAIINPPHGTILAIGAGEERPWSEGGTLRSAMVMSVTLSCDHRVVDGALAAEALATFRGFINNPVLMIL